MDNNQFYPNRQTQPFYARNAEHKTQLAEFIAFITVRSRYLQNPTGTMKDLYFSRHNNKVWSRNFIDNAEDLTQYKTQLKNDINSARQQLDTISTDPETRLACMKILATDEPLTATATEDLQILDNAQAHATATDYEDIVHTVLTAICELTPDTETPETFSQLCKIAHQYIISQTSANIRTSLKSVNHIATQAEIDYLFTRYSLTLLERKTERNTQHNLINPRIQLTNGEYITIESKRLKRDFDPAKVTPATIATYADTDTNRILCYLKSIRGKYQTANETTIPTPAQFALDMFERMDEQQKNRFIHETLKALNIEATNGEALYVCHYYPVFRQTKSVNEMNDKDPDSATPAIIGNERISLDAFKRVLDSTRLSYQAKTAVYSLLSSETIAKAESARNAKLKANLDSIEKIQATRVAMGKKPYNPGTVKQMKKAGEQSAENEYIAVLWETALTKAGYSKKNHRDAKSTIIQKLITATATADENILETKAIKRIFADTYRGHTDSTPDRTPGTAETRTAKIVFYGNAYYITNTQPRTVDPMSTDYPKPNSNPAQIERLNKQQFNRRYKALPKRQSEQAIITAYREHLINIIEPIQGTATAIETARIFDSLPTSKKLDIATTAQRAERARINAEREHAERMTDIRTMQTSFDQWQKMTPAEQAEHIEKLNSHE